MAAVVQVCRIANRTLSFSANKFRVSCKYLSNYILLVLFILCILCRYSNNLLYSTKKPMYVMLIGMYVHIILMNGNSVISVATTSITQASAGKHWRTERVVAVGLLGLIPAGVMYPNPVMDYALAVLIPLHNHW